MIEGKEFFEAVNEINEKFLKNWAKHTKCIDCDGTGKVSPGFDNDPMTCHCQREQSV